MEKKVILFMVFAFMITFITSLYAKPTNFSGKAHHVKAEVTCEDCHETSAPEFAPEESACVNCHGDKDSLMEVSKNKGLTNNPHFDHEGGIDCASCHKEHQASVLYCSECHSWRLVTP